MFFDDRLATVLRQRQSSDIGLRTQFRQLLDILGAEKLGAGSTRDPSLIATAWMRMDVLAGRIPAADRARMVREPGWRFRNPQLAAHLANFEPDVASAALNRAQLSVEDWSALIPRLPVRARGFLRLRRDLPVDVEQLLDRLGVSDRGLPSPTGTTDAASEIYELKEEVPPQDTVDADPASGAPPTERPPPRPPAFDPQQEGRSEISALVERIAQFKRTREAPRDFDSPDQPRLPLGENMAAHAKQARTFGFAADAAGRIEWADSEVAPMVIGTRLVAPPRLGSPANENQIDRSFLRRQPITGAPLRLDGAEAITGEWIVDAQPRFTEDGNFAGYVGRCRRPSGTDPNAPSAAEREADRIRQLLHELRTPVNAVQGYAEVIQTQLFGTAPHEYRALAAAIAADAARILAGFDELDRLAKLEAGVIAMDEGATDLTTLARRTTAQLAQVLRPRMAGIEIADDGTEPVVVALGKDELEALLWRLLATLGGGCAAGELLEAEVTSDDRMVRLTCALPAQLLGEDDIFTADAKPLGTAINAGLFGAGFALRLARAEARAAGGDLEREEHAITLTLPAAAVYALEAGQPEN